MSDFTCKKLNRPARINGLKQKVTEAASPDETFLKSLRGKSPEEIYAFVSFALPRLPKGAGSGAFSSFTNYYSTKEVAGQQLFTSKDVEGALEELANADADTLCKVAEYALMHWCDASEAQRIISAYSRENNQGLGEAEGDEPDADAPADDGETSPVDDTGDEPPANEGDDLPDLSDEPTPADGEGETPADDQPAEPADDSEGDEDIDSIIAGLDDEGSEEGEEGDTADDQPEDGGEETDAEPPADDTEAGAEGGDEDQPAEDDEPVEGFDGETVAKFIAKHIGIEDPEEIIDAIESAL